MSREDVALLVFRTLALWVGSLGFVAVVSMVARPPDGTEIGDWAIVAAVVPLVIAAGLWLLSPPLARATFGRGGEAAPLAVTAAGIPPLACFVVGVLEIAAAIPAGAEWFALRVMQYRDAGLMAPATDIGRAFDAQGVATGASVVARLLVGAVLIVLSRRRDLWAAGTDAPAE